MATDLTQAPGQLDVTQLEEVMGRVPVCEWPNAEGSHWSNSHECTEEAVARMLYSCGHPHRLICEGGISYLSNDVAFRKCRWCGARLARCRKVVRF